MLTAEIDVLITAVTDATLSLYDLQRDGHRPLPLRLFLQRLNFDIPFLVVLHLSLGPSTAYSIGFLVRILSWNRRNPHCNRLGNRCFQYIRKMPDANGNEGVRERRPFESGQFPR